MAAKDKSRQRGLDYPYKSYVVGDYKDLLESLRTEDTKGSHGKRESPVETEKPLAEAENPSIVEQDESPVETNELIEATVPAPEEEKPPVEEKEPIIIEGKEAIIEKTVEDELAAAIVSPPAAEEPLPKKEKSMIAADELAAAIDLVIKKGELPASAQTLSVMAEKLPTMAAATLVEAEKVPVANEPSSEIETPTVAEPPAEIEKPPVATEELPAKTEEPPVATEELPAKTEETPVATEELPAKTEEPPVATEELPAKTEESSVATEELPAKTEEPPTETEESNIAKNEPAATVEKVAAVNIPAEKIPLPKKKPTPTTKGKEQTAQSPQPTPSVAETPSKGGSLHKDVLCFNLTMIFLLAAIATVLLYSPNMGSFSMFLLISFMIFNMIASYNLGLQKGLIVAVVMTFTYGSYILYETMITRNIAEINFAYIAWLFFFPMGSLLSGQLANSISSYRWALENKKSLEKYVTIDASTGFYNKQGFFRKMDEEFTRAQRYKTKFSVLLINIANFNELRIIYGDINSVSILKTVADIVTTQVRFSDVKSLIEENMLAVILTETDEDGAKIVIEKMHIALDRVTTEIDNVKKVIRIKPNIGIASMKEGDRDSLEIYERAKDEINYDRG